MSNNFYTTINEAIADIETHGYDSQSRIDRWMERIELAAREAMLPESSVRNALANTLTGVWRRQVERGIVLKNHPGISRYSLEHIKPTLRADLDRRIMASAQLIKLNRQQSIAKTLQRFSGWATSIPAGGSKVVDKPEVRDDLKKALRSLPYEERRVAIDQGHKLVATINDLVAVEGGAIAGEWHSNFRQPGYDARPDHAERDGHVYLIRGNWASAQGLVKPGPAGWSDEITQPAEEVFCFPGDSKIPFAEGVTKAYRRWFDGELAEVVTDSGKTLRGTPNHPVLTTRGWVALGVLQESDEVIEIADELLKGFEKNQDDGIPTIAQVFRTLQENGVTQPLGLRPADFHGDGSDSNVDVVFSARELTFGVKPHSAQSGDQFEFPVTDITTASIGALNESIERLGFSAQGLMGGGSTGGALIDGHLLHTDAVSRALVAQGDTGCREPFPESRAGNTEFATQNQQALSRNIRVAKVCQVKRFAFSGHVYNLQTRNEWYVTSAIVTHNCRCQFHYIYSLRRLPEGMLTAKGRAGLMTAQRTA